jgi:ribosome-binding factor A
MDMTTIIVSIEKGANTRSITAAMRQLKGVAKVKVQKEATFERIPGLSYTHEERIESIGNAEENIRIGNVYSAREVRAMFPEP